ncbi:MAG: hypothetical protein NWE95_06540 [Candidatus Bathyarchaeota archaeon]|nr:hypothetical protein [Candidatus Bathyarchaeota archaeon]
MVDMKKQAEIPCTSCQSWNSKQKKFSCNPDDCKELTTWLFANAPQLRKETVQLQVRLPEIAIKYVV